MTETTVLYTLSTLAQTCAALAAFVGAVGLYRVQSVASRRSTQLINIRAWLGSGAEVMTMTQQQVLDLARQRQQEIPNVVPILREWDVVLEPTYRSRVMWFSIFEGWNLFVILLSLVGFNYVECLATWKGTFWTLWVVALGTVGVTGWSVYAWTRG
jgi:hypothetical protein